MMVAKFRKKPVIVEAMHFERGEDGLDNGDEIIAWSRNVVKRFETPKEYRPLLQVETPEGLMNVEVGSWLSKGVAGEFYPCKNMVFLETYEPVEEELDVVVQTS